MSGMDDFKKLSRTDAIGIGVMLAIAALTYLAAIMPTMAHHDSAEQMRSVLAAQQRKSATAAATYRSAYLDGWRDGHSRPTRYFYNENGVPLGTLDREYIDEMHVPLGRTDWVLTEKDKHG